MNMPLPDMSYSAFLVKGMQLYEAMQRDIQLFQKKELERETTIQGCFDITHNYRSKLNDEVSSYSFENTAAEVCFFKTIKPLFNAEAEYHTYCYHAEIFLKTVEDSDPMEAELFYRRQLQRMEKFSRDHRELYEYLMADRIDRDTEWFTRLADNPASSFYDKQVGTWLAIRRYEEIVQDKLQKLAAVSDLKKKNEE